jgi:hypothetical protein
MDKNLSWTSSLGDAYYNQQPDVMDAVQVMRRRAQQAGNLKSAPQQTIETQDSTIIIQPAAPEVVYVPAYDPWVVYGDPIVAWPGWYPYPGIWYDGPYLSFGTGFEIGFFGGFGWGWHHWGSDWRHRSVIHDHDRYSSHSSTFYNRNNFYRGGGAGGKGFNRPGARSGGFNRTGEVAMPFNGDARAARGYAEPQGQSGVRSGTFSGGERGGEARGFSSRGSSSFGGGSFGGGRSGGGPAGGGFGGGRGGGHGGGGGRR